MVGKSLEEENKSSQTSVTIAHMRGVTILQKHCTQTQKCHSLFYATAGIVAYAHGSTNPIKLLGRLTEAIG